MAHRYDPTEDVALPVSEPERAKGTAETRPIEAWAEQKGLLPQLQEGPAGPRFNPGYWKFAAARAFMGWPQGQLVTEADFDRAVDEQAKQVSR